MILSKVRYLQSILRKLFRVLAYAKSFVIAGLYANLSKLKNDRLKTNTALQMKDAGIEFKAV